MGFYTESYREIAFDNFGEVAVPRLSLRPLDGSNHLMHSDDFTEAKWGKTTNLLAFGSGSGNPYGSAHLFLVSGTSPTNWEYIKQDISDVTADVFVFWGLFKEYTANPGRLYLLHSGPPGTQSVYFDWASGVPTVHSAHGNERAGVIDVGDGWYVCWYASRLDESGANPYGNLQSFRVYPSGGSSIAGRGVYCAHLQVELGTDASGPRTTENIANGPYAALRTTDAPRTRGPGQLIVVDDEDATLQVNPVKVKREKEFGVVHAQQWQATFSNESLRFAGVDLAGAWAALEMGFPAADEWGLVAQGRIVTATTSSELKCTIDVDSPMSEMIERPLQRSVRFDDDDAWSSPVETIVKSDDSSIYDNDETGAGTEVYSPASVRDRSFEIEFLTATTFKFVRDDGTEDDNGGAGYAISADADIDGVRVLSPGWSSDSGAYAAGDRFQFFSSKQRTGAHACTPIPLLKELLTSKDFLALSVFGVREGYEYTTPLYEESTVWGFAALTNHAVQRYRTTSMKGTWEIGTEIIDLVQGILRVINASLYTMPNGQIALWETQPNELNAVDLNGDPARGPVNILSIRQRDALDEIFNRVRYKYRSLNTQDQAELTDSTTDTDLTIDRTRTVDLGMWEVDKASLLAAADKLLQRLRRNRRSYTIRTTLIGSVLDLDEPIAFVDPMLQVVQQSLVRERAWAAMQNEADLVAQLDPVVLANYAVVGDETVPNATTVGDTTKFVF